MINGMEMPKHPTAIRIQIEADGSVYQNSDKTGNGWALQKNVTATEVPTPHGRLIDADKLRAEFPHPNDWRNPELAYAHLSGIWATIDCAETIIEAEDGT